MVRYALLFWGIHDMICFKRASFLACQCLTAGQVMLRSEKVFYGKETEDGAAGKRKRGGKGKAIAAASALFAAAAAVVGGFVFYFSPAQQYIRAMKKGDASMGSGAYAEAAVCYDKAFSIDASEEAKQAVAKAYTKMGDTALTAGEYEKAFSCYDEAMQLGVTSELYAGEARAAAKQGNVQWAMDILQDGLALYGEDGALEREKEYLLENSYKKTATTYGADGIRLCREFNKQGITTRYAEYDGDGELTYEVAYDDNGFLLWTKGSAGESAYTYDESGNLTDYFYTSYRYPEDAWREEAEFDGQLRETKRIRYDWLDRVQYYCTTEWNDSENTILTVSVDYYYEGESREPYGEDKQVVKNTLDGYGNSAAMETTYFYNNEENAKSTEQYIRTYDGSGNVLTVRAVYDGVPGETERRNTYDGNGRVIKTEDIQTDGFGNEEIEYMEEYEYFPSGNIFRTSESHVNYCFETEYDEDGRTVYSGYSDGDGSEGRSYTYDEHGNLLTEETTGRQYAFYTYEYSYNAFKDMVWSYDPYQDKEITYSYEYALK